MAELDKEISQAAQDAKPHAAPQVTPDGKLEGVAANAQEAELQSLGLSDETCTASLYSDADGNYECCDVPAGLPRTKRKATKRTPRRIFSFLGRLRIPPRRRDHLTSRTSIA